MSQRALDALWRRYLKAVRAGDRLSELTLAAKLHAADYRVPA